MKSTHNKKPINILAEFICEWVHDNSSDSAPYESFETVTGRQIKQLDVERWILNCNYLYYRLGDFLQQRKLIESDKPESNELLAFLEANAKTIKDSNPLNLRSKQDDSIVKELSKDWPPMAHTSRNQLETLRAKAAAFQAAYPNTAFHQAFDDFFRIMQTEQHFYGALTKKHGGVGCVIKRCRELVPLWCAKEINPLYSLLLWNDPQAIDRLCSQLQVAFSNTGMPAYTSGLGAESWTGIVKRSQHSYLDALDNTDLSRMEIPDIASLLDSTFFSLERPAPAASVPDWLFGKSQLIWNVVMCAVFGPRAALTDAHPIRTSTQLVPHAAFQTDPDNLHGEVLLRRRFRTGRLETIDRLAIDQVQSSGLWKVIGSAYDESAALPTSKYREQYKSLGVLFIGSQRIGELGNIIEGQGDSRFHAEIAVEKQNDGSSHLILRDLNSKNGTYVIRQCTGKTRYLAFKGRDHATAAAWAQRLDVAADCITMVASLALRRGDVIQLCGSCFEVI